MDLADYTAFGPFAPIYIETKKQLLKERNRALMSVLEALSCYANHVGICYPGSQALGDLAGYAPLTIDKQLGILLKRDFLRIHATFNARRNKYEMEFQISPFVLWIASDAIHTALNEWENALTYEKLEAFPDILRRFVTYNIQPEEPEPETRAREPEPETRARTNIIIHQQSASNNEVPNAIADEYQEADLPPQREAQNQRAKRNKPVRSTEPQRKAPNSESTPPHVPTPPPNKLALGGDMSPYHAALPDINRELLAQTVKALCDTTLPQARQLVVLTNDDILIKNALEHMQDRARKGLIKKSAYGMVRYFIESNAVAPFDTPTAKDTGLSLSSAESHKTIEFVVSTIQMGFDDASNIVDRYGSDVVKRALKQCVSTKKMAISDFVSTVKKLSEAKT